MSDVLLTLHCAVHDTEAVVEAVRAVCQVPLHLRAEAVRGRDFGDAGTAEKVSGALKRTTLEVVIDEHMIPDLLRRVHASRRELPVRWRTTPLIDQGRIA